MITCKEYATIRKELLAEKICNLMSEDKSLDYPRLAIIQVGNDFGSGKYVANKIKDCEDVGIVPVHIQIPEAVTQVELNNIVEAAGVCADGVIVQLPLPSHLDMDTCKYLIQPWADVDGFRNDSTFTPCTPKGVMSILAINKIKLCGANVVIVGRGMLVGRPLMDLMIKANATVTLCHSHTKNLKEHCLNADIIVSAVGKPGMITADMVKEGAVVIDVGISRDENGKQIGDCDYPNLKDKCKFITPWTNGTGLMTRISLIENVVEAYEHRANADFY